MGLSHWASGARYEQYVSAYDASMELWPIPYSSTLVDTPHGATHVITSGATDGEPLVLLHAASLSAVQWHLQAAELGRTYRLHAVDIVGDIGRSIQKKPVRSRAHAAEWLAAVLDRLGVQRATLVGASFGGFLAANLAVLQPSAVRALVLLAPAATVQPFSKPAKLFIRLGGLIPLPATVRPGLRAMMGGNLPDERIVHQMEVGVAGFRYDRLGLFPSDLPDAALRSIRCPTLVVVGAEERIYDPNAAIARARELVPDVLVALLSGLGHLPSMQDPRLVNGIILQFLSQRASGSVTASIPSPRQSAGRSSCF